MSKAKKAIDKTVEAIKHDEATRKNIPTAEYQSMVQEDDEAYIKVAYERRNKDLDPQLIWRGKDITDWSDLVVQAPPLYIQEKVHPKALVDELMRQSKEQDYASGKIMADLFSDFNGLPKDADKTEFYQHDQHWSNRMILGDSLQVMASLAEREGLRGLVQCIYFDPPYGIKFNSNFQWSTTTRDSKKENIESITREPEQVKAFRDTWQDGIHSYLTYIRERLTVARDLLSDSGSLFVQISDDNLHLIRCLLDEIFGSDNFVSIISVTKTSGLEAANRISSRLDYLIWYCKDSKKIKYRTQFEKKLDFLEAGFTYLENNEGIRRPLSKEEKSDSTLIPKNSKLFKSEDLTKPGPGSKYEVSYNNKIYNSGNRWWGTTKDSLEKLIKSDRVLQSATVLRYVRYLDDFPYKTLSNLWDGIGGAVNPTYVVQTSTEIIQRCILMTTDTGDLVLDPTCGGGTTAYVAEQWGRRWITIDTSRVALALARIRIMGSKFSYYLLSDSKEGRLKEAEVTRTAPSMMPTNNNIRHGFVYERVPHVTLKSIANNAEIDVIWDKWQKI